MARLWTARGEETEDTFGTLECALGLEFDAWLCEDLDTEYEACGEDESSAWLSVQTWRARTRAQHLLHDAHVAFEQASVKCLDTCLCEEHGGIDTGFAHW